MKAMPASKQEYKKRAERLSFCMANRKRYEVTCDLESRMSQRLILGEFQYRKRYEVTCDEKFIDKKAGDIVRFQYRKRYEVTCDN